MLLQALMPMALAAAPISATPPACTPDTITVVDTHTSAPLQSGYGRTEFDDPTVRVDPLGEARVVAVAPGEAAKVAAEWGAAYQYNLWATFDKSDVGRAWDTMNGVPKRATDITRFGSEKDRSAMLAAWPDIESEVGSVRAFARDVDAQIGAADELLSSGALTKNERVAVQGRRDVLASRRAALVDALHRAGYPQATVRNGVVALGTFDSGSQDWGGFVRAYGRLDAEMGGPLPRLSTETVANVLSPMERDAAWTEANRTVDARGLTSTHGRYGVFLVGDPSCRPADVHVSASTSGGTRDFLSTGATTIDLA